MNNVTIVISKLDEKSFSMAIRLAEKCFTPDIVLMSEAVYMLREQGGYSEDMNKAVNAGARLYAISEDIKKRGIEDLVNRVSLIDYSELVDLLLGEPRSTINL